MKEIIYISPISKQKGMAVLIMSVILLVLITLISLYLARSILLEQHLINNSIRSEQAFEAAESGLLMTMKEINTNEFYATDDDGVISAGNHDSDSDGINDSNFFTYEQTTALITVETSIVNEQTAYTLTSIGSVLDGSATRTIGSKMQSISPIVNTPDNPVSARSNVFFEGSGTVWNLEGHSTIWSGGDVKLKSSSSKKTYIADPGDPNYPGCMDTQDTAPCEPVLSSDSGKVGLDVIEYDSDLTNLSDVDLFENFFGLSPAAYREKMPDKDCTTWDCVTTGEIESQVIWMEGDVTNNGGTIGSMDKPSILIINGDYDANNIEMYGLLFVMGNMTTSGNSSITGALVVGGSATEGGSFDIFYNSRLLQDLTTIGISTTSAGSWRDFE